MQFKNVIGQQFVKEKLVNLVQQNRLSHALLFLGKEGCGALPLALAFSQYIVCTSTGAVTQPDPHLPEAASNSRQTQEAADSCGICPACQKAGLLIHPDIHFSFPVITKKPGEVPVSADFISQWREFLKGSPYGNAYDWLQFISAENKQGNITSKECEEINHIIHLKSFESRYKILVMSMPEFLGKEGNKLLKLIEEPPPDTLFIFVAEDETAILPTIVSRTQLVKIPFLHTHDVEIALLADGANEVTARQIAGVCQGNYREALQMLQHSEEDWQSRVREWLNTILKTGPAAQVKWVEDMSKLGREKQKQFLRYFIYLIQHAVRMAVANDTGENGPLTNQIPEKDKDFALRLNRLCNLGVLDAIITELDKAIYYVERNAHAKMLFHALTIRLYHIIKDNSLILVN